MPESRREMLARLMGDAGRTARPLIGRRLANVERALGAEQGESPRRAGAVAVPVSRQRVIQLARELDVPVPGATLSAMLRVSLVLTIGPGRRDPPWAGERHERTMLTLSLREPLLAGSDLSPGEGVLRLARVSGGWSLCHDADADTGAGHSAHSLVGERHVGVVVSRELLLPRQWSDEVGKLGLDEHGIEAWGRLRERLAAEHERELFGECDGGVVSHRWLGLPDDRSGSMPLECELRARGLFEEGVAPDAHERDEEVDFQCSRWRLLLQLSADPRIGWSWGARGERLHVWMTGEDMRAGRFDHALVLFR